jgi:lipoprotein-anchoring transpeptidase ErfK/SrfK
METWHAVVAFQSRQGLLRDGVVGPRTRAALARARPPQPWQRARRALEVDLRRQVLPLVADGRTVRAIHVSTAAPGYHTPTGSFHVYFQEGHAIHGYPSVPRYPASHGCVRVPLGDAPDVYAFAPLERPVTVR